jgi:hypothetical protein
MFDFVMWAKTLLWTVVLVYLLRREEWFLDEVGGGASACDDRVQLGPIGDSGRRRDMAPRNFS